MRIRLLVRITLAAAGIATLGACATVPERAWNNGRALSTSQAYQRAIRGDMSLSTHRQLLSESSPLRLHSEVRWTPSGSSER
jgi:hypothetical protein